MTCKRQSSGRFWEMLLSLNRQMCRKRTPFVSSVFASCMGSCPVSGDVVHRAGSVMTQGGGQREDRVWTLMASSGVEEPAYLQTSP